ncbi:hypothetical protein [Haliovirga abyssi]|uniref:Type II secretion system protein GspC N-terminal domain-containing protein n=1 Tax=Haliovirga abyssi TaxID=2996794 RepID=A0AAU9DEL0_9FUSO|nr:hypothetical protein [Haliovirga abyssi]BDU49777.1 hypothetical protein HLVA_03460 [Haliovirga abyssi]
MNKSQIRKMKKYIYIFILLSILNLIIELSPINKSNVLDIKKTKENIKKIKKKLENKTENFNIKAINISSDKILIKDIKKIKENNFFLKSTNIKNKKEVQEELKLPLDLLAISEQGDKSKILVRYMGQTYILGEGEKIASRYKVKKISGDKVIFEYNNSEYIIKFEK